MFNKITAFFLSILLFFASLFGTCVKTKKHIIYHNLSYGSHQRQKLDLYIPRNAEGNVDLILEIHGGGWIAGDKECYTDELKSISADRGYVAAALNYRYISDDIHAEDILDDITSALGKIKATAAKHGVDVQRVLLTGASAGGHLSLLYGYSRATEAPISPACIVSFCGPTELGSKDFYYSNALGDSATMFDLMSKCCGFRFDESNKAQAEPYIKKASPLTFVTESSIPTVICHGEKDSVVPYGNAVALDKKLTELGVKHDFVSYPNSDHDLSGDPDCSQRADELMWQYAAKYLSK